jgi:hypothetical protein
MTPGLLISRDSKLKLHKTSITYPTPFNIENYKNYRKIYQKHYELKKNYISQTN